MFVNLAPAAKIGNAIPPTENSATVANNEHGGSRSVGGFQTGKDGIDLTFRDLSHCGVGRHGQHGSEQRDG